MVADEQFTLRLDGRHRRTHADADQDKTILLRGLIESYEARHYSLKSCDPFLVFHPSTRPQDIQDLHCFGNAMISTILKKYEVILHLDKGTTLRE